MANSVTANGQTLVKAVAYVPFGMATGWTAGNGASYKRAVDLDGRISGLALPASNTIALVYDLASRITGLTETGVAAQTFSYDALDRLHVYASGTATQTYAYDANGNRASYATNGTSAVSLVYTIDKASNRLLGISGSSSETFTYDASGNMLSYSAPFAGYTFTYDARNRQTEAFVGAIGTPYLINGLGQRVSQYAASAPLYNFAYDEAGHTIGKYDASGNADQQETVWLGDLPVAVLTPSSQYYIAPDHLGAPHQITNASGAVAWQWNHDPFGNGDPTDPLGTFSYDLLFPGQFFDQATHLHYNYFRDYDPRLGRYIESDPIGLAGGINTYAYVYSNPVLFTDPNGTADAAPPAIPGVGTIGANIATQAWIAGFCGNSAACSTLLNSVNNLATNAIRSGGQSFNSCQAAFNAGAGQLALWVEGMAGETPVLSSTLAGLPAIGQEINNLQSPTSLPPVLPGTPPILVPQGPILLPFKSP